MEREKDFTKLSPDEEKKSKRVIVDPDSGQVLTAKEAEERSRERKENPDWFREQQ